MMKITCPSCDTSYKLPEGAVGPEGRRVKCANCGTKWKVEPPETTADLRAMPEPVAEVATQSPAKNQQNETIDADFEDVSETSKDEAADQPRQLSDIDVGQSTALVHSALSDETQAPKDPVNTVEPLMRSAHEREKKVKQKINNRERRNAWWNKRVVQPSIFAATLTLLIGLIIARDPIVRHVPDLASLYALAGFSVNLRGFEIKNVRSERVIESSGPVLIVSGEIENITAAISEAPKLRFGLKTTTNEEIYAWEHSLSIPTIVPGGVARFQSRLPSPPTLGRRLSVRFTDEG